MDIDEVIGRDTTQNVAHAPQKKHKIDEKKTKSAAVINKISDEIDENLDVSIFYF